MVVRADKLKSWMVAPSLWLLLCYYFAVHILLYNIQMSMITSHLEWQALEKGNL